MRTVIIILLGLLLWGICLGVGRLIGGAAAATGATVAFLVLWLLAAGGNLWVGVTRAGYAFREELPIFLLIFAVPAAVALLVRFRWLNAPGG